MAVQLEEYLRTQLPVRRSEIEQIGATASAVLKGFRLAFDTRRKAWPYRLDRDQPPCAVYNPDDTDSYSFSTNSMVLFALRAILGDFHLLTATIAGKTCDLSWSRENVGLLTPMLSRPDQDLLVSAPEETLEPEERRERWTALVEKFRPLVAATGEELGRQIDQQLKNHLRLTDSGTFGENDPFTLCWVLEALGVQDHWVELLSQPVKAVLHQPQDFRLGTENVASAHALPLLRGLQMYSVLTRLGKCSEQSLSEVRNWFEGRLHEHLSYSSIPDSSFDAPELIFALEGLLICEPQSLGIERLLQRVLAVVQEKQRHNPNLRPYRPILSDERGRALLPLTIEVFSSLLRISERLTSDNSRVIDFDAIHSILKRYAQWLLGQRSHIEEIPDGQVSGWSSEHTNARDCIHVWETSQILLFLVHYGALLQEHLQRSLLDAANFTSSRPSLKDYMPRTQAECEKREPCQDVRLYRDIWDHFIQPRASLPTRNAKFSLLLFGPPGTGKTTFAEYLAAMLGWELLILSPSDFIERGDQGVEAPAKVIFSCLQELSDKVVLFDEIDRLLLDRDSPQYARQDDIFQFMTPSMLTKLRTLRRLEKVIFVVATNYEDRIDSAAKRHGRIDDKIPVMPPDKSGREVFLETQLKKRGWSKPSEESWMRAVAKSALLTFPELNDAIKRAFPSSGSSQTAFDEFIRNVESRIPEIRITTYKSRFGLEPSADGKPTRPSQVPATEFRLLCKIARENPALKECVDDLVNTIPGTTGQAAST